MEADSFLYLHQNHLHSHWFHYKDKICILLICCYFQMLRN